VDGRRGHDGKVKQVEGLILLLMFYEIYVESYLLTLTALEVQPWPESLHCVDILCLSIAAHTLHPLFGLFSLGVGQTEWIGGGALHTKNIVQVPPQVYLRSKE
jgi:hypothetical protein